MYTVPAVSTRAIKPADGAAPYVGRFAPSPTGPLHLGSLLAALGSYLDARHHGGRWLLRIEDIDPPREQPGAADAILHTLDVYGFEWDGEVLWQSRRHDAYQEAIDRLRRNGTAYPCGCTRSEIAAAARIGSEGPVYPGTCRDGLPPGKHARAIRVRTLDEPVAFDDRLQGYQTQSLARDIGDFVIRRADGLIAYQLAVVVDDAHQGITDVVRGADLLDSTPRQIHLQHLFELPTPRYLHLPLAVDPRGDKLSKQTHAPALPDDRPVPHLVQALRLLGLDPPAGLERSNLAECWAWALTHWQPDHLPRQRMVRSEFHQHRYDS
ncbi:MAG: tRNA glutamyl-Q(34) synthetase GluQRS [Ectothiorhodospiraceae bacterium]|nr:tRNA glutamyl-Q(34) synthetase GluQRS [Ectothiorhodospiraceae bacterium]